MRAAAFSIILKPSSLNGRKAMENAVTVVFSFVDNITLPVMNNQWMTLS